MNIVSVIIKPFLLIFHTTVMINLFGTTSFEVDSPPWHQNQDIMNLADT